MPRYQEEVELGEGSYKQRAWGSFEGSLAGHHWARVGRRWPNAKEIAGRRTEATLAPRMSSAHSEAEGTIAFMQKSSVDAA